MTYESEKPIPTDRPEDDPRITAYVFGQLEGDELAAFEAKLQEDPEYRRAVDETTQLDAQLRSVEDWSEPVATEISADRREQLLAAFAQSQPEDGDGVDMEGAEHTTRLVKPTASSAIPTTAESPSGKKTRWGRIALGVLATSALLMVMVQQYRVNPESEFQTISSSLGGKSPEPSKPGLADWLFGSDESSGTKQLAYREESPASADSLESTIQPGNDSSLDSSAVPAQGLSTADGEVPDSPSGSPYAVPPSVATAPQDAEGYAGSGAMRKKFDSDAERETGSGAYAVPSRTQPATASGGSAFGMGGGMSGGNSDGDGYGSASGMGGGDLGGYGSGPESGMDGNGQPAEGESITYSMDDKAALGGPGSAGGYPGGGSASGGYPVASSPEGAPAAGQPASTNRLNTDAALEGFSEQAPAGAFYGEPLSERGRGRDVRNSHFDFNPPARPAIRNGDRYETIHENDFVKVVQQPVSTFSIDVDTAAYSKMRTMLTRYGRMPDPNSVRIEELVNYFDYDYPQPEDESVPFTAAMEVADCPWKDGHRLARIAIKGREIETNQRSVSNLVFLLDVSGSMDQPNKLPLVRRGLEMLVRQLGENDRVAIVVYAGAAGRVLDSTTADRQAEILQALDRLRAGGSTNGGEGIQLAYQVARDHFVEGGTNRVILCTDGDFNVGTTGTEDLVSMVEREARGGIFLTVLGFGTGNLNDAMLESISGRGDGQYAFIDNMTEARKVLVEQLAGTLVTIAKNVKIQIEFNPTRVAAYRLIGYENRVMPNRDFDDDTKDAGEIGAGHTVTALYEIVPAGGAHPTDTDLRYQPTPEPQPEVEVDDAVQNELLNLKLRYMDPQGGPSRLQEFPIVDQPGGFEQASQDFRFAASVAGFGMLLRRSKYRGSATYERMAEVARDSLGEDPRGLRSEFLGLIDTAAHLDQWR